MQRPSRYHGAAIDASHSGNVRSLVVVFVTGLAMLGAVYAFGTIPDWPEPDVRTMADEEFIGSGCLSLVALLSAGGFLWIVLSPKVRIPCMADEYRMLPHHEELRESLVESPDQMMAVVGLTWILAGILCAVLVSIGAAPEYFMLLVPCPFTMIGADLIRRRRHTPFPVPASCYAHLLVVCALSPGDRMGQEYLMPCWAILVVLTIYIVMRYMIAAVGSLATIRGTKSS